ncbi:MAG: YbaB/EbfC family nucleoid-associated protein [Patescibacteria group bacterium]|jgi:DNA-binding protein YbaB
MFNKLRQIKDLRSQAKSIQNVLSQETIESEKGGIKIVMNGNLEVQSVSINDGIAKESQEGILKDLINDTIKKTQKIMAKKMQEMGGLPGF